MNRVCFALIVLLAASLCFGQTESSAPPRAATPNALGHGAFPVKLTKTLDSSKLKEGDTVEAETAGSFKLPDGTLVPKGSKLTGHVTAAKARSKGDPESQLTVAFDKLNVASGKQLAVKGMVQAVFPAADEGMDPSITGAATTAAGGSLGGYGAPVGTVTGAKSGSSLESSAKSESAMSPKSVGVQGVDNLQLDNGVLSSKGKNVKLGNGVRMIIHVDILG